MKDKSILSENEIIDLCKKGNNKAYLHLYDKYSRAMYNVAYRFMNDADLAQDMMQEGFIKAFSKLDLYSQDVIFGGWLKKIIINRCLDEIRKKKDVVSFDDAIFREPVLLSGNDYYENPELLENIKQNINNLPEKYRVVVNLNLIEGYDYDEISSILNIKNTTARSLVSRAKSKLRESIDLTLLNNAENDGVSSFAGF